MRIDESFKYSIPLNCIAFYKGDLLPDWVLEYIVNAATRGHITEAGRNLWLIPIKVYEQAKNDQQAKADQEGRRRRKKESNFRSGPAGPSIKKWECVPLTSFLPKKRSQRKGRLRQNRVSIPLFSMPPRGVNRNACTRHQSTNKRNANCHYCDVSMGPKRRDAKYCSNACKQAAHRLRGRTQ